MSSNKKISGRRLAPSLLCLMGGLAPMAAAADPAAQAPASAQPPAQAAPAAGMSANARLLGLLVKRKILTEAEAADLLREADAEAAAAAKAAPAPAPTAVAAGAPPNDGAVHVTYVPEIVKKQLRAEIKQDVLAEAKAENWAAPNTFPEWVSRLRFSGDLRARYDGTFFPSGNDTTGSFANFNAINTGAPFDTSAGNPNFPPQNNVDQNRNRYRLRARLGVDADLGDDFSAGIRIATGETNSPVTENQSLGAAGSGQGGNFSKYAVWLDRAFISYEPVKGADQDLSITVGRFANPFFSTSLLWADDLNFDGAAIEGKYEIARGVTPFTTIGAFPVFNTDFNFASNQPAKFASHDKWLYAAEAGANVNITRKDTVTLAAAYYYFDNIEGRLSSPCTVLSAADSCDTDQTRPTFAQKGNTYRPLRNIVATTNNGLGTTNQFQYYGLATPFHELAVTGRIDVGQFAPVHVVLDGEFVKNLAFNKTALGNIAVNNRPVIATGTPNTFVLGPFEGGDTGYFLGLTIGEPVLAARWDWNLGFGYKHIESDAIVDGFTDSDFGLGGTNLKGYVASGSLALARSVWTRLRWMSADSIAGPPLKVDVLQVDLNAKF